MNEQELKRFNAKYIETESGCWVWTGSKTKDGYGYMWVGAKSGYAHRAAYEHFIGQIPEGDKLYHLCENFFCCNPHHLELVSMKKPMDPQMKKCSHCKKVHPLTFFRNNKSSPDGKRDSCKECDQASDAKRRNAPNYSAKIKMYPTKTMKVVGFTRKDYQREWERQGGKCAICGQPETAKNQWGLKRLAVDHDHATGKFRGLLCQKCNLQLGGLEDHSFIALAQAYLQKRSSASS